MSDAVTVPVRARDRSRERGGELSWRWGIGAVLSLAAALLGGLALGPAGIPPVGIVGDLVARVPMVDAHSSLSALDSAVLWELRAPRVVLGALVGGTLALAGGSYQAVFRNPLADPYLLGAAAGAGLGATVAIVYVGSVPLPLAAFAGATAAVGGAYLLGRSVGGGRNTATLILAGVAVAAFLTAVQTLLLQQDTENVRAIYAWLLGRLSTSGWGDVLLVLPYAAFSTITVLAHRRVLDVLRVGDEEALGLGVPVARVRVLVIGAATLGTAAAVAVSGLIGFVGIVVPHAVRLLAGTSYRVAPPVGSVRSDLPGAGRRDRPHGAVPGRASDRRRDRLHRRALLRDGAAHDQGGDDVIALEQVAVRLGGRTVVDDVTLHVEHGGWTTLIGPNGAGKTTLLRAVAGAVSHGGSVRVGGRELRTVHSRVRARTLATVPQSPLLPPDMSVSEYVLLGRTPHLGMLGRPGRTDRDAVDEAIRRLDLGSLAGRRLDALSGGERQRAVLARALAQEAPVLLLDEPTTALDVGRQQEVLELVGELRAERGLTVLGAMHDLTLAGQYADRLALLDGGRLVGHGRPAEVLTESLIGRHYRARVHVAELDGTPVVMPARPEAAA